MAKARELDNRAAGKFLGLLFLCLAAGCYAAGLLLSFLIFCFLALRAEWFPEFQRRAVKAVKAFREARAAEDGVLDQSQD